jgi:hypothetical protein
MLDSTTSRRSSKIVSIHRRAESPTAKHAEIRQRLTTLNALEVEQVNELRKDKGLSPFPLGSVLLEFYPFIEDKREEKRVLLRRGSKKMVGAARYVESGFLVLTPIN